MRSTVRDSEPARHTATPEWLTRRDRQSLSWTVTPGPLLRGEAFTDLSTCHMRIPIGDDQTSRCVRAHELMHAKVSPHSLWRPEGFAHLTDDLLITAEEFRVNQLVKAAGFPVDVHLADGSEVRSGERIGANNDWNAAVLMITATSGTKASKGVFTGLRRTQPDWVKPLRLLDRRLIKHWRRSTITGVDAVASTRTWGDATLGWRFTIDVACLIHASLRSNDEMTNPASFELGAGGSRGEFARPVIVDLPLVHRASGGLRPRRAPTTIGRHPRRIERLLTDPDRRVFDRRLRTPGGVIVVDQSGSMRLSDEQVWDLIRAAPGCTVIGYSHEARSSGVGNIWILARNGRVVDRVPRGNGGNGVDGPALRFAASLRRRGDPFIWVCDGYVTDAFDDHSDALTRECASLVVQHRIHQVPDIAAAITALSRASHGFRLPVVALGPVGAIHLST